MSRIFLFILSFLFSFSLSAQLRIVKDNIACLYGLKNASGEWVVPPAYISIQNYGPGFFMTKAGGSGLIGPDGKLILNPLYDYIYFVNHDHDFYRMDKNRYSQSIAKQPFVIIASNKDSSLVINSNGKFYFSSKAKSISADAAKHFLLRWQDDSYSYTDSLGRVIFGPRKGGMCLFGFSDITAAGQYASLGWVSGKKNCGVIRKNGDTLIPFHYDYIRIQGQYIIAMLDGLHEILDTSGKILLPRKYHIVNGMNDGFYISNINQTEPMVIMADHKYGLLASDLHTIIEPEYTALERIYSSFGEPNYRWKSRIWKKTGAISREGKIMLPAVYDSIIPVWTKVNGDYNQNVVNFVVVTNKKFSLVDLKGSVLTGNYESFVFAKSTSCASVAVLISGDSAYALGNNGTKYPVKMIVHVNDSTKLWKIEDEFFVTQGKGFRLRSASNYYSEFTRLGDKFLIGSGSTAIFLNSDGSLWMNGRHLRTTEFMYSYSYFVCTNSNRWGMISKDGTWLLDTVYHAISSSHFELGSRYWVRRNPKANAQKEYAQGHGCRGNWELVDSNGKNIVDGKFAYPFSLHENFAPAVTDSLWGLYSYRDKKFVIQPSYKAVEKLNNVFYKAYIRNDKFYVFDTTGRKIDQSAWQGSEILFSVAANQNPGSKKKLSEYISWILLYSDSSAAILNSKKDFYTNKIFVDSIRAARQIAETNGGIWPYLYQSNAKALDSLKRNISNKEYLDIFHHLASFISEKNKTSDRNSADAAQQYLCMCKTGGYGAVSEYFRRNPGKPLAPGKESYSFTYLGSAVYSVHSYYLPSGVWDDDFYYQPGEYMNFEKTGAGFSRVYLKDFIKGDSVSILNQLLTEAIKKRDDLHLPCSPENSYFTQTAGRFSFRATGLVLYLPSQNYVDPHQLLIPWAELKPYLISGAVSREFLK